MGASQIFDPKGEMYLKEDICIFHSSYPNVNTRVGLD